ncbi:MAG: Asp-tRNA(Asn)/Glu-tRNA(Gln) amidotransferase subunit GatB [Cyanobacteriota bacterium]|nr:Asp-tRNA(Asn)/Glu-tRNA(Gln) amidotransferase subunit GatB [Cyanobacteriota bacterium]
MTLAAPTPSLSTTQYEAVIGLEVHCQLQTASKIFCECSTTFGGDPNAQVCPICMGMPGVLPVLNEKVLEYAVKAGLALHCSIAPYSKFDRKQYFYPDLPKNYQISQYDLPIATHGWLEIQLTDGRRKQIGITRLHMEEDAGKLVHAGSDRLSGSTHSLVDFNRTGTPLAEIVSEPDIRTGEEAAEYVQELRRILRYLEICDGNLQEGSMRCDVNISVRPLGSQTFGTKVEIKNMNSFNAIQRAIDYEFHRQVKAVEAGEKLIQETRLWDENGQRTISMRKKEGSSDYRYFPEPDLLPIRVSQDQLTTWQQELPELPAQKRQRYQEEYGLSVYDARYLSDDRQTADYFERVLQQGADAKAVANWMMSDMASYLNTHRQDYTTIALQPETLAELIALIELGTISSKIAKDILPELLEKGGSARELVTAKGLTQISDSSALQQIIQAILDENPTQLEQYRSGKTKLLGYFVGQLMKKTQGRADPQLANTLLQQKLDQAD